AGDAGVVDEDVHRAELGGGALEEPGDGPFVGDVALTRPGSSAARTYGGDELAGRLLALLEHHADGSAVRRERVRDAASDAARAAGDDGDAAREARFVQRGFNRGDGLICQVTANSTLREAAGPRDERSTAA